MGRDIPEAELNSGFRMPLVGLGTSAYPASSPPDAVYEAVVHAIEVGYRHFDTAPVYGSEVPLGEAIAHAVDRGLVGSRDRLFITSKLWCTDTHPDGVLPALRKTLELLQLEYLDLYLIHFPVRMMGEMSFELNGELAPIDINGTWAAMEECQRLGLTKSIGVSNFSSRKLNNLLNTAKIPPAVNQVEMHPRWQQKKLREFCASKGILVSAWSPLGGTGGSNVVLDDHVLKEIAEARGKTVAQVCLRWGFQQGVCLVVKSFNKERMKENLNFLDWELLEEELEKIHSLPQGRLLPGLQFVSPSGPYKSVEEFWDGEV